MIVTFTRTFTVDAPEGATHYCGDLLEEALVEDPGEREERGVTWWKYKENETGTFKGWCWYRRTKDRVKNLEPGWYIHGEHMPPFLNEIPKEQDHG